MDTLVRGSKTDYQMARKATTVTTVISAPAILLDILAFNIDIADNFLQLYDIASVPRGAVSAVATHADGSKYTSTAHGLAVGDRVIHEGFTDTAYNGDQPVLTVVDANNYTTVATYTATGTGTFITKPKMVIPIPGGDGGTLYGNQKQASVLPTHFENGPVFGSVLAYYVATTPGGRTDPTTGSWVNMTYLPF